MYFGEKEYAKFYSISFCQDNNTIINNKEVSVGEIPKK